MIKIVTDTNVIVSAYLVPGGKPDGILSLARAGEVGIFLSPQIIEEVKRTLLSPKLTKMHKATPGENGRFVESLEKIVSMTPGVEEVNVVIEDPDDKKILACALEGRVDYIVSGDHHLTELKSFRGISIVNPDTFLKTIQTLSH